MYTRIQYTRARSAYNITYEYDHRRFTGVAGCTLYRHLRILFEYCLQLKSQQFCDGLEKRDLNLIYRTPND